VTASILPFRGVLPRVDPTAFIAPGSNLAGDIVIGAGSSIWLGCQLRGDVNVIRVGEKVNLQDGSVIHVSSKGQGTLIGDRCTIGHMVLLHDCILEADSFVGMNACVMDGAVVESYAMVAAGAGHAGQTYSQRRVVGRTTGPIYAQVDGRGTCRD
jgi:carbonic anhydrase/acetyltransferase-like protein (isoleucine patch superfamily)